jgi:hypothetical protein
VTFLTFFLNLGKGTTYRGVVNALSNTIFDGSKAALASIPQGFPRDNFSLSA